MSLTNFDIEVLQLAKLKRVQGIKKIAIVYAVFCLLGAAVDAVVGAPLYLITILFLASVLSFSLSVFSSDDQITHVERVLVVLWAIVILAISFQDKIVLSLTFYIPLVLFLGFVEKSEKWRFGLLSFIGGCFLSSYLILPDDFLLNFSNEELFIGFLDMGIMCALIAVVIRYFSGLNNFAYRLANTAEKEATLVLLEAKNAKQNLQVQQASYLSAQQRDTEAVELHRKQRSVLSARQEELEQFAYAASHDLKEPVRTIKSFIQIVRKRLPEGLEQELRLGEYFDLVSSNTGGMHKLLESLLDYSRAMQSSLHPEEVSLKSALEAVLSKETGISYGIDAAQDLSVYIDVAALKKIILVLLSNAKKFVVSDQLPAIKIEVLAKAEKHQLLSLPDVSSSNVERTFIQLRFSDNGIGIAEEYHQKVFQLFQRLHKREEYAGAGIGLTLARRLVEKSNGSIWIETAKSGGTCVCVELPSCPLDLSKPE